jgi:hypothetical protein
MFKGIAWLRRRAGWSRVGLLVAVGAVAVLDGFAGAPQPAVAAESAIPDASVGAPLAAAAAEPTSPGGSGGATCPSPNPPNTLTLVAGTPQTAPLEAAFATGLQVALANSDGCPVTGAAGVPVTFSAPPGGASGLFSSSGSSAVTVGGDATGTAAAPTFTANGTAGSYTVVASSQYGSVSFSLTNTVAGVWCSTLDRRVPLSAGEPVKLTAGVGATQSTASGTRFPIRLAVTVTDVEGNPVPGTPVTFAAPVRGASARFTIRSQSASRARGDRLRISHPHTVKVETDACGIAVAPALTAGRRGGYIVKASAGHARPAAFALVNEAPGRRP